MAKTEQTIELEKKLYSNTTRQGVFGCFEVTIGWFGNERCDYITYDTKGIWRCYEIKVSKSDFNSKAKKTFVGHFNYYVMPKELYEQVKDQVPSHIGVHNGSCCLKNAKKQKLSVDEQILKDSLIRSLCRDANKLYKLEDPNYLNNLKGKLAKFEKEKNEWRKNYYDLNRRVREKFGRNWDKED